MTTAEWATLRVQTFPPVTDPREMTTILTFSLRDLFGDFESHSCVMQVTTDEDGIMKIKCPSESIKDIRAALILVTPPPYMAANQYRFDVLDVTELERC